MTADSTHPWPKHHRIYLVLRQQIRDRAYPAQTMLPPELDLARQFDVSRITIRRALQRLEQEGLIDRHRGRGTFVTASPDAVLNVVQASVSGKIGKLLALGLGTDVRVDAFDYVEAEREVSAALALAERAIVQKSVRVRSIDGRPISLLTAYVPQALGRTFARSDLAAHPLLSLIEKAGVRIEAIEQTVTATLATPDVAAPLGVEPGDALLRIRRIVQDRTGAPVQYLIGLYRADAHEERSRLPHSRGMD